MNQDLVDTTHHTFIPFDEAWDIVMNLMDQLDIPDYSGCRMFRQEHIELRGVIIGLQIGVCPY